jgi:membrane protein DedA with SNARE-associated domain
MGGVWVFLFIANLFGLGNNTYIKMLDQFSIIGFSIIYLIVLVYGIIDFYRIFNKSGKHDSIQLGLDEVGGDEKK